MKHARLALAPLILAAFGCDPVPTSLGLVEAPQSVGVPGFESAKKVHPPVPAKLRPAYLEAIRKTAAMYENPQATRLAAAQGLDVLSLTWEDTGRFKDSAVGPNISDMTIQIHDGARAWCMPVIRHPNFSDKSCDIDPREFTLLVGNHLGQSLRRISLYDFLKDPTPFLSKPSSWKSRNRTLLAPRDERVLVSAQACFLPVPKQGTATFNPVLFNYQSERGNPGVLTILATREGTSVTVIDNSRDAFAEGAAWGQRLFHNEAGMRASLTGTRLSDFRATPEGQKTQGGVELSMVLLIQVPLKQRHFLREMKAAPTEMYAKSAAKKGGASDVEAAVIGHGQLEGPFTEFDNLSVERDPNYPVRVTVQFYKATSNGIVSRADIRQIRQDIDRIYSQSDAVGSLVTEGETGRVTEYVGAKIQPPFWWEDFWLRYEQEHHISREAAIARLKKLLTPDYQSHPVSELYLRTLLSPRRQPKKPS